MLEKKSTDANVSESKGIPVNQPFNFIETLKGIEDIGEIVSSNIDFTGKALDVLTESINIMETAATKLAFGFGGMRGLTASIKQNMEGAAASVIELGGSLEDVASIQEGVVKALQTQTILNKEAYADLYAVGNLVGDGSKVTAESSKKMVEGFMNAGYGLYDVSNQVLGIINKSRELGVTTAAVYGQISTNIGKLALYNFENGVQGMAQMAAKAASLRIEMGSTLKIAEELFDPEKAIDMAASMQRLGVNVASLLDPYKLMDMARNDPAKLQEEILKASQALTYFDEKNQKMAILPGAQQTLREMAKAFGMNADELAKMALNAGDLDRKLREIKFSPDFAGDEQARTMIANMAQLKDGKYVVTFDEMNKETGQIESVTKEVSQLTKDNKEALVKMNEPAKSAIELQKEGNNTLTNINNSIKALKGVVPRRLAASPLLDKGMKKVGNIVSPLVEGAGGAAGFTRDKSGRLNTDKTGKKIDAATNNIVEMLSDLATGKRDIYQVGADLKKDLQNVINLKETLKGFDNAANRKRDELINKGETMGPKYDVLGFLEKYGKVKNDSKGVTPNNVSPVSTSVTSSQLNRDKLINSGYQNNNPSYSNNINEFKSTIDIHLKVDPADLQATVMNYLRTEELKKLVSKQIVNNYSENMAIRGNTPKAKINILE